MTTKRKATDLVSKFLESDKMVFNIEGAKECALIAVDEILEILYKIVRVTASSYVIDQVEYYLEVKQEIEKL